MSLRRQRRPFRAYSLSPERYRRRVTITSSGISSIVKRPAAGGASTGSRASPAAVSSRSPSLPSGAGASRTPGIGSAVSVSRAAGAREGPSSPAAAPVWPFPPPLPLPPAPPTFLKCSETSAIPSGRRPSLPLKITSSILSLLSELAFCSPRTHEMASPMLLLPQPFGPTTAVIPGGNSNRVRP